jgi:hypothetical protein
VSHVDGNAIAGVLETVFGRDLTAAAGRCSGCGAEREVGAIHVYRAAGVVARCPDCDTVLLRIVEAGDRIWIDLRGLTALELPN